MPDRPSASDAADTAAAPGLRFGPWTAALPGLRSAPWAAVMTGLRSAPVTAAVPGLRSAPAAAARPTMLSAPGWRRDALGTGHGDPVGRVGRVAMGVALVAG